MAKQDGGPAFGGAYDDVLIDASQTPRFDPVKMERRVRGMSLRDYFAGQALPIVFQFIEHSNGPMLAKHAYEIADAMLAEREK